jgi:hypothetical protein
LLNNELKIGEKMQVNPSVKSLESICLEFILRDFNEKNKLVEKIKGQIPEKLFSKLYQMQRKTVNLKANNWNNHNFCVGIIKDFPIQQPLSKILEHISIETQTQWKKVYIEDLDWNRKHPDAPMWETADCTKTLSDYDFKPAEDVIVLLDRV